MTETIKAWHFVGNTLRDGRPVPKDGAWLRHAGQIRICASGLHASRQPWDALRYAPGSTLCYVECRGDVHEHGDKLVCRERRIIMRADVSETLRYFARMRALSVVHLWTSELPDFALDYLMTGDESLRGAAQDASWVTSRNTASDAASSAAWAASVEVASVLAWAAASAAASSAASSAARAAASAEASDAASAEASDAASAATWDAVGQEFDALVCEQFGVEA